MSISSTLTLKNIPNQIRNRNRGFNIIFNELIGHSKENKTFNFQINFRNITTVVVKIAELKRKESRLSEALLGTNNENGSSTQ